MSEESLEAEDELDIPDAEAFRREQEREAAERAEWPQRLERLCREAHERWRAVHPWVDDPGLCVTVPVTRLFLPDESC
jgi:hypothetical protein